MGISMSTPSFWKWEFCMLGGLKSPPHQVILIKSDQGAQLENLSVRVLEQPRVVVSVERPKGPGVFPKWRSL